MDEIHYKKIIYTEEQLKERIQQLGKQITSDYKDQELVILGVL